VTTPLRRGPNGFGRVSWDEAMTDIADRLADGRSATSRPSSTVATMPHSGSQIRQNVIFCSRAFCSTDTSGC
jgi:anaerobic selenocysteine-containing dehydrogenase